MNVINYKCMYCTFVFIQCCYVYIIVGYCPVNEIVILYIIN